MAILGKNERTVELDHYSSEGANIIMLMLRLQEILTGHKKHIHFPFVLMLLQPEESKVQVSYLIIYLIIYRLAGLLRSNLRFSVHGLCKDRGIFLHSRLN